MHAIAVRLASSAVHIGAARNAKDQLIIVVSVAKFKQEKIFNCWICQAKPKQGGVRQWERCVIRLRALFAKTKPRKPP